MPQPSHQPTPNGRQGVIGVIQQEDRFLVIKRSQFVRAPGRFCFPGGGIEAGETQAQALVREMQEELTVDAIAVRHVWTNFTRSGVELFWWKTELPDGFVIRPNLEEVESFEWLSLEQIMKRRGLLQTNYEFLTAFTNRKFEL